ncbi:MAG: hypothetical protein AAGL90_15650 [Pseudomonadota bacterium]
MKHAPLHTVAVLMTLSALGACETAIPTETSLEVPMAAATADPVTGEGEAFPPITHSEVPEIRFGRMQDVGPVERQFFVDQINLAASSGGRDIPIVVQSVGEGRQTLVFMSLASDEAPTPYIARAMLARMTSVLRFAPPIAEMGLGQDLDVYNMAAILGFERIVVTDGRAFSYEARLERPVR